MVETMHPLKRKNLLTIKMNKINKRTKQAILSRLTSFGHQQDSNV